MMLGGWCRLETLVDSECDYNLSEDKRRYIWLKTLQHPLCAGAGGEGGAAQHAAGGAHQAARQGAQERPGRARAGAQTQKSSK